jgi:hypothetical protein
MTLAERFEKNVKELRTIAYCFIAIFGGAILYSVITVTACKVWENEHDTIIHEVNDNYVSILLVINFMESYSLQLKEATVIANKDSVAFNDMKIKYDALRMQWFKDLKTIRGFSGMSASAGTINSE